MRHPTVLCCLVLACALAGAAGAQGEPQIEIFRPVSAEEAVVNLLAPGTPGAAVELANAGSCSPTKRRTAVVALAWAADGAVGSARRIDISKFRDGFEKDRYETSGRLPRDQFAAAVEGPEPGVNYYWRVLTETADGWIPSATARFEVPTCVWDPAYPPGAERPENPEPPAEGARPKSEGGAGS